MTSYGSGDPRDAHDVFINGASSRRRNSALPWSICAGRYRRREPLTDSICINLKATAQLRGPDRHTLVHSGRVSGLGIKDMITALGMTSIQGMSNRIELDVSRDRIFSDMGGCKLLVKLFWRLYRYPMWIY